MANASDSKVLGEDVARIASATSEEERRRELLASFTPEDDRRIRRKIDTRFLLLIGMMYLIKNIDYTNAASVKVLQVKEDRNVLTELKMTTEEYNWVQSIYFISYIVFEVPSNMLLKKLTPRLWQSRIMLTWGVVLACHAAVQNKQGLWALRFLLGMCEAGMFPGLAAQLCGWYRSDEMGTPIMWMFAFQNASGVIGSIITYGISYMNGMRGLSAWRWVYILEGIFTILFAGVVYLVLPDWPKSERTRKWLTEREQEYVEARLSENAPKTGDSNFSKDEVIASLKDPRTYSFMLSQVLVNFAGYALSWELPTITTSLGFAGLPRNQLLNIPPAGASVLAIIFSGWFLKRGHVTRPAYIVFGIMGPMLLFFILLATLTSKVGIYIACVFGTMFYAVYFIPFWAWRSASLKGTTGSAFTLAFQSCVGQVGGVIGPQLFQPRFAHNGYKTPFAICAGVIAASWLANVWTWWLTRNVEWDVLRVQRLRIQEKRQGRIYAGEDIKVYNERSFYSGIGKKASAVDEV